MATGIRCPQPTTLTLVRHGQSQANVDRCFGGHSPSPLTDLGREQAASTADHLAETLAQHVYSSDLLRAVQTAEPIASRLGVELRQKPGLRERSVGDLDGRTFRYAQEERPELWEGLLGQDPDWVPPGGESVREAYERMGTSLREILEAHVGDHIVVVTHAIAIHLGINALLATGSPGAMGIYFSVSNASCSTFIVGPGRTQVSAINQTYHLPLGTR